MADETSAGSRLSQVLVSWRIHLLERIIVLLAFALVLVTLVGLERLRFSDALLALLATIVAAALLPRTVDPFEAAGRSARGRDGSGESAIRSVADALSDPCIVLDQKSTVRHRNTAAARQFPGLAVGNPVAFSLRAPDFLAAIEKVRRTGEPQTVEMYQTVPTETWNRVSVAPLDGDAVPPGTLLVTMQNLTEAKRLDSLRTDFIANASHELRTPLTSLVGFIDTLLGPAANDPAARTRFLGIMRQQAGRMSKLIDDLLSLSRIEMRQHMRPTSSVDLSGLLREVGEGLQTQAAESGVVINFDLPQEETVVTGDRDELYEVFENLIDNAIKYGADGKKVDVALTSKGVRHGYDYAVTVTDYGPGVEAEHVPRLTERFYRVDAESSRKKKGTGLGLAIVKHILTRHHGLLAIRSQPGQGTRIEVLLPR